MKTVFGWLVLLIISASCSAQVNIPMGGTSPSNDSGHKTTHFTSRILTGTVLDKSDKAIAGAVVYLKNTKTLAMKTYIAQRRWHLSFSRSFRLNVDYEVYAEKDGKKSKTKTLSQFDDREKPNINLQIDTSK